MTSTAKKIFYGWWVVASGCILYLFGSGTVFYGFNVFFNPMIKEFGWSRTVTSGAFSMSRLEGGLGGPVAGWLIDKYGARKLAFIGGLITGLGFIALLLVNDNPLSLYLIFGLLSLAYNAGFQHAAMAAVAKWFIKKRSLALSIVTAGAAIGGGLVVPGLAWLTAQYGWRTAVVITGLVLLVLGQPTAALLRSKPEDMGLFPDGEAVAKTSTTASTEPVTRSEEKSPPANSSGEIDFTVREAFKTGAFWIYNVAFLLRSGVQSSIVLHEIPYLVERGIDYQIAANILGIMIFVSLPGRLICGWLGDKFGKNILLFINMLLQATGIWIFLNANTIGELYLFVVVFGLGYGGAIPLLFSYRADLFGRKYFATISGIISALAVIPTVGAPVVIGYIFDVSQSYYMSFYTLLFLTIISGFLFLLVKRPKPPARLRDTITGIH